MRCDEMPQVDVKARMEGSTCCGWAAWPEGGSAVEVRQWGWSFFPFAACRCLCRRGEQTLIMGILNVTPDWLANVLQCLQIGFDSAEVFLNFGLHNFPCGGFLQRRRRSFPDSASCWRLRCPQAGWAREVVLKSTRFRQRRRWLQCPAWTFW